MKVPDDFVGLVGVSGRDGADIVHGALFHHCEGVAGLSENWGLVYIQHPHCYLSKHVYKSLKQ